MKTLSFNTNFSNVNVIFHVTNEEQRMCIRNYNNVYWEGVRLYRKIKWVE
jgi:hypothetical protein